MADSHVHKNCVVLVTHRMDAPMLRYLRFLQKEMTEVMDFCILYDCHFQKLDPADYRDLRFHLFDSGTIERFFHGGNRRLPHPLLPLLDFAQKEAYEHYLLMEVDLVFTGEWRSFLRKINGLACDYVHIATDLLGDPRHWPCKYMKDFPFPRLYFAWCHIFYASRHFLEDINAFIQENNTIYYEFLLPSMAYNRGYYVRQFENFGYQFQVSWGPPEVFERKYTEEHAANTFYHPIKDSSIINF